MKTKITFLLLLLLSILTVSCTKYQDFYGSADGDDKGGGNNAKPTVKISDNQIIVRFKPNFPEKERVKLRKAAGVGKNYELCSCGDKNLELWGIDPGMITIEGAISALRGRSGSEGDFQFTFSTPGVPGYETLGVKGQLDPKLANTGFRSDQIDIAVLDTGIDFGQPFTKDPFTEPYLYNTTGLNDCPTLTGWNFIEGTDNVLDDNGHGTFVTKIITSTLDSKNLGYRILPLKLFTQNGEGSYWNVVCAFGYLNMMVNEGNNIDIVNASFGGTVESQLFDEQGLLNKMIKELADKGVLVVTSAGNEYKDTDNGPLKHFPSGYVADNILAVGGYAIDGAGNVFIHKGPPGSNYGPQSIDLAAPFAGWNVQLENRPDAILEGTSYGTAYVTGLTSAYFIAERRPGPIELKIKFLISDETKVSDELKPYFNGGKYVE